MASDLIYKCCHRFASVSAVQSDSVEFFKKVHRFHSLLSETCILFNKEIMPYINIVIGYFDQWERGVS